MSAPMRTVDYARLAEQVDEPTWTESGTGLIVPHARGHSRRRYHRPVAVDTFSGAGGFGLGFHQAGWHVAAGIEWDPTASLTYLTNLARPGVQIHVDDDRMAAFEKVVRKKLGAEGYAIAEGMGQAEARKLYEQMYRGGLVAGSGWIAGQPADHPGCEHFWIGDIRKISGQDILEALELEPGEPDCVFGGPPCQGMSKANRNAGAMDPRNSYIFDFARLVLELRPKTFVIENVPQLLKMVTPEGVPVLDAFSRVLADESFATYDAIRNAIRDRPDVRMVLRQDGGGKAEPEPEDDEDDGDDGDAAVQGDLFEVGS